MMEKLLAHRETPIPSLRDVQADVPDGAARPIFAKMVAKKAEDRYQSMTEVIADLERAIAGHSAPGNLAPPGETTDTGLTRFFQNLPAGTTQQAKPSATRQAIGATRPGGRGQAEFDPGASGLNQVQPQPRQQSADDRAKRRPNPKHFLYGSIAAGILSLIGIPLVLYLALSGNKSANEEDLKGNPSVAVVGVPQYALEFDGKAFASAPVAYDGSHSLTLEAWVMPTGPGTMEDIRDKSRTGLVFRSNNSGVSLGTISLESRRRGNANHWEFVVIDHSGKENRIRSADQFAFNQRTHLVGVLDGDRAKLYVDGRLAGEAKLASSRAPAKAPFCLGGEWWASQPSFVGRIHAVHISKVRGMPPTSLRPSISLRMPARWPCISATKERATC